MTAGLHAQQGRVLPCLLRAAPAWSVPKSALVALQRQQAELAQEIWGAKSNVHPASHRRPSSIHQAMWAQCRFAHLWQRLAKTKPTSQPQPPKEQRWHCQDALSLPCPRSGPGMQHLAPDLPGQAAPSSPSIGEGPQRRRLTMFLLLSRCAPRQRGMSGCSSRSRSWPKPCRAHASGHLPPLPRPFLAPPRTATAPAQTISPCPCRRGKTVSPRFWPSGIFFCLPKQPPCSCLGHGKGSLLVITEWWAPSHQYTPALAEKGSAPD